jgi:hypothetical protein
MWATRGHKRFTYSASCCNYGSALSCNRGPAACRRLHASVYAWQLCMALKLVFKYMGTIIIIIIMIL